MPKTMKSKSQNTIPTSLPLNPSGNSNRPPDTGGSLDPTAQTGLSNGGDWQEEVYQKNKAMPEMYLPELKRNVPAHCCKVTGAEAKLTTLAQPQALSLAISSGISVSPLLAEFTASDGGHANALTTVSGMPNFTEQPLDRLLKAGQFISPKALSASVSDIESVDNMVGKIAGSAPGNESRAIGGEDLVAMANCCLQERNFSTQYGMNGTRKRRPNSSAAPLDVVSSTGSIIDSFKLFNGPETSDLGLTAASSVKRPRLELNHDLLVEIRKINLQLIDTAVDISEEDVGPTVAAEVGERTIVKCSFVAVALSANFKSQFSSAQMSPIQPLRLLVPANYPNSSPILMDKLPVEVSKECEDLSVKAKWRLGRYLRSLSQPISLGEIARPWDASVHAVITGHAQLSGGGSFSSKYGTWENC